MRHIYFFIFLLFCGTTTLGQVILSQDFNGTPDWTTSNSSFDGDVAAAAWTLRPDGYHYVDVIFLIDETFHSNDASQFYLTNADAQAGTNTETILQSPGFSTVGYTQVTVSIYQFFQQYISDVGYVEASTNGVNWVNVKSYQTTQGTASAFSQGIINLNAYAGLPNVYIRFRYVSSGGFYWAIDNVTVTGSTAPLPISLLAFSGYREGNHNLLKWSTTSEQNNKGFQVERSTDGVSYSAIGFVNSRSVNGNSTSLLHYTFNDNSLQGSKQYYRLRQVDIDQREKLSNIILIKGARQTVLSLGLFPNPANNIVNVIVDAPDGDNVELEITGINGKLIRKEFATVETGTNTIPIDISRLTSGIYTVKLTRESNGETVTGKFIKQ